MAIAITTKSEHQSLSGNPARVSVMHDTNNLRIQSYSSFDDLEVLRQAWDNFMESIGGEIFLTFDWCRIWWKYYGKYRELKVYLFTLDEEIIAILPVFFERLRIGPLSLGVVKFVSSDFMPVTISPPIHRDHIKKVIPLFLAEISSIWSWDLLYIGDISGRYTQLNALTEILGSVLQDSHAIECKQTDVQTYFDVANSFDEQLAGLSSHQRTKTKRVFKELNEKNIVLHTQVATANDYVTLMNDFINMHQIQWQHLGMAGHFGDWPQARELHHELAAAQIERGRLRLLKIVFDDQCAGYEYIYSFGSAYCWFLGARTDLSKYPRINFYRISFREKINHAIKDQVKIIDALRGKYDYKLELGGKQYPIHCISIHSNKLAANIKCQLFKKLTWLLNLMYMKIWRRRLAPRLHLNSMPIWKLWVKTRLFS